MRYNTEPLHVIMEITFGSSAKRLLHIIVNCGWRHKAIRSFDDLFVIWKTTAFMCPENVKSPGNILVHLGAI